MRLFLTLFALLFALNPLAHAAKDGRNLVVASGGSAGKRVALVIGNGNYKYADTLPKLANPTHDAEDIAKALRGFGFEVIERKDQSLEAMSDAIAEFGRKLAESDAALFYYAGHGLQVKGQNYIVPVDAKIESEAQVPFRSVNVSQVLEEMDSGKSRANIVMLDACRNNPISGKFRSGATRGLAAPASSPKGTVIVYATDPGNVAADGSGRNGLFTAGLLTALKGSDLSLGGVLARTSEEVERGSGQKQTPYINGPATLQKNFSFAPGATVTHVAQADSPAPQPAIVQQPEPPPVRANSRYIIKGGEVYDKKTDLTWQRCSVGQRWEEGNGCVGMVKTFTFDQARQQGGGAWRVPSKDELATLIDQERKSNKQKPTIDVDAFPDMDLEKLWYWSSTPPRNTAEWDVSFSGGDFSGCNGGSGCTGPVRLVRGGQ